MPRICQTLDQLLGYERLVALFRSTKGAVGGSFTLNTQFAFVMTATAPGMSLGSITDSRPCDNNELRAVGAAARQKCDAHPCRHRSKVHARDKLSHLSHPPPRAQVPVLTPGHRLVWSPGARETVLVA